MNFDRNMEYETLRQEILDSITARDNYIVAMYTITAAILCVAFELQNPILFLIPYVILFAFQNSMTTKNENMIVLAAYIAVYLEDGNGWESNAFELKKTMHKGAPFKRAGSIWKFLVGRIGSVQLGLLCSLACIVFAVLKLVTASQTDEMVLPIICIVLSITLYILIRVLTKNVLNLRDQKSLYIQNLRNAKNSKETIVS